MRLVDADAIRAALYDDFYTYEASQLADYLERFPTIEAEPVRHSFWESYSTSAYGGYKDGEVRWLPRKFYRCERCRKGSAIRSHYCPSCGAKMEG